MQSPKYFMAQQLLGDALLRQRKEQEAEIALDRAMELNPQSDRPYRILGRSRMERGETHKAIRIYEHGLGATGRGPNLLVELGLLSVCARESQNEPFEQALAQNVYFPGINDKCPAAAKSASDG